MIHRAVGGDEFADACYHAGHDRLCHVNADLRGDHRPAPNEAYRCARHDHTRRLGHRACAWRDRRASRVRHGLRTGRGRLQPRRDELPDRAGPPQRGGRRQDPGTGSSGETVCRSVRPSREVCAESGLAQEPDGRVGGRPELLPGDARHDHPEGHQAVRAVDGSGLHRRKHRRRHRADSASRSRSVLRRAGCRSARRPGCTRYPWTDGIQRHCHRAVQHQRPPRPAADQPAHLLLFPFRAADDKRRRAERLRRRNLGPVLHLSGLQRAGGMDAHLQPLRCRGPVPGDHRPEERPAGLPLWERRAAGDGIGRHALVSQGQWQPRREDIQDLQDRTRSDRRDGGRWTLDS